MKGILVWVALQIAGNLAAAGAMEERRWFIVGAVALGWVGLLVGLLIIYLVTMHGVPDDVALPTVGDAV